MDYFISILEQIASLTIHEEWATADKLAEALKEDPEDLDDFIKTQMEEHVKRDAQAAQPDRYKLTIKGKQALVDRF